MSEGAAWMDGQSEPTPVVAETLPFTREGVEVTTVAEFTRQAILHQAHQLGRIESGDIRIYATLDTLRVRNNNATGEDIELMLRSEPDGMLHHVDKVNVVWEAALSRESVELEHGGLHGMPFAFGSFGLLSRRLIIVNPADESATHSKRAGTSRSIACRT